MCDDSCFFLARGSNAEKCHEDSVAEGPKRIAKGDSNSDIAVTRMTATTAAAMIEAEADTVLIQFDKSNAVTSRVSQLAEAAIIVHVASAFINKQHAVWY